MTDEAEIRGRRETRAQRLFDWLNQVCIDLGIDDEGGEDDSRSAD